MTTNFMVLLLLNLVVVCTAYFESPKIIIQGKSLRSASALDQAAEILNVSVPGKILLYYRLNRCSLNELFLNYSSQLG
jgi:hypothetical protein